MALLALLPRAIAALCVLGLAYRLTIVFYNIFLHPLARFPGPKLAAATRTYEWFYRFYYKGGGRFSDKLYSLHQQYGAIVRINPGEVHILDRSMYDELFNFNPELDKRLYHEGSTLQTSPSFATHKRRRKFFNPYFSRASIAKMEPAMHAGVEKLCDRIREARDVGAVVKLSMLFRCFTCDVVSDYTLLDGFHFLNDPSAHETFWQGFNEMLKNIRPLIEIPPLAIALKLLQSLPSWLQRSPSETSLVFIRFWTQHLAPKVQKLVAADYGAEKERGFPVIIEEYIKSPEVPASEKTEMHIRDNLQMFVVAGMETVGYALSMAIFQLLTCPSHYKRLQMELREVWPDGAPLPSWHQLEQLPFLTAVIKESLRMSVGVMSRLNRINHHRPMQFEEWTIPPGTVISMSQRFILNDAEIYPNPERFAPERWMQGEASKECDRWLVCFSKGARICIGVNMAWAELYLALAAVVRRFDFELFETEELDIVPTREYFMPFPERENGVRVMVKKSVTS